MSSTMLKLVAMLAILFAFAFAHSEAISCWQCNSFASQFCADVPAGPVANTSNLPSCFQEMYKECPDNGELPYTFCRKNEQTIKGTKRIIRSCGFDKAPQECYITKTPSVITRVCQCYTDGCNSAGHVTVGMFTMLAALLINRFLIN